MTTTGSSDARAAFGHAAMVRIDCGCHLSQLLLLEKRSTSTQPRAITWSFWWSGPHQNQAHTPQLGRLAPVLVAWQAGAQRCTPQPQHAGQKIFQLEVAGTVPTHASICFFGGFDYHRNLMPCRPLINEDRSGGALDFRTTRTHAGCGPKFFTYAGWPP